MGTTDSKKYSDFTDCPAGLVHDATNGCHLRDCEYGVNREGECMPEPLSCEYALDTTTNACMLEPEWMKKTAPAVIDKYVAGLLGFTNEEGAECTPYPEYVNADREFVGREASNSDPPLTAGLNAVRPYCAEGMICKGWKHGSYGKCERE